VILRRLPNSSISPRARRFSIPDSHAAHDPTPERDPADELVTSIANPAVKFAITLQRRRNRERADAALVEGVRAIGAAVDTGARLRLLFVDAGRAALAPKRELARFRAAAERVVYVSPAPFHAMADTEHPQPLLAVFDTPPRPLPHNATLVVALDAVQDPGNLGTLVRSAVAAGADGVALLPGTVDAFNPKAVRASAGTIFGVAHERFADVGAIAAACFDAPPLVIVADAHAERAHDQVDWTLPVLLVVGSEAHGVGASPRTYAHLGVHIPMAPGIESLNAAVAGAVLLFEAARQRRAAE
jgi:TrmH family RNA methyltransferase